MHRPGLGRGRFRAFQWAAYAVAVLVSLLLLSVHCADARLSPDTLYQSIERLFISGELAKAETASRRAATFAGARDGHWATRFRLQRAKIRIYQGHSEDALALLHPPLAGSEAGLAAIRGSLLAIAYHRSGDDTHAQQALDDALQHSPDQPYRASLSLAQGVLDTENDRLTDGEHDFSLSLAGARAGGDRFLETQSELNLGVVALRQEHYDDALRHFSQATALAKTIGARLALEKAAGALGSTLYKVGDYKAALASSQLAEEQAASLGSPIDQVAWLDDEGLSQFRLGDLAAAKSSYEHTLELAHTLHDDEEDVEAGEALTALAWLALESGDPAGALARSHEALQLAARRKEPTAAAQPALVEALVLARQGSFSTAENKLLALEQSSTMKQSIHWQVEHALSTLYADRGQPQPAEAWFRRAIATFQTQRSSISNLDSRLPFFENGNSLYLSYVEFLIREGKTNAALAILDQSRAETLAEGLGVASTRQPEIASASRTHLSLTSAANAQALARQLHGTILVYCLRPGTSYLWAISPAQSGFFRLPGRDVILPLVAAHTQAILTAKDVLAQPGTSGQVSGQAPGQALYRDLVAPAATFVAPHGKVFIIADDSLNALNFETLIPPGAAPHYWVEDADIVNARSIGLLAASRPKQQSSQGSRRLLLVGDPVYTHPEDGKLAQAAEEVSRVAAHFSPDRRLVLTGAQATPAAYQHSHPESFAYIHFVAHASASEIAPLDSSVILSAAPEAAGAYKLYARSILDQRLTADLVTISACYGSGVRSYSGEGLVGLAWAFLHTGSHQVIGALWEVSDASTPQLMGDLYDSLSAGSQPDAALRSAKLAMIHRGGVFRKPFYWAAFQLYSGA